MFTVTAAGVVTVSTEYRFFRVLDIETGRTSILAVRFTEERTTTVSEEALMEMLFNNHYEIREIM